MSADYYSKSRLRFEAETREHVMSIIRDDGLYRHVRFKRPDDTFYFYDLVTWPGYLAIVGDAGDYLFSRIRDMFDFFNDHGYGINPDYWAQKLQGREVGRSGAKSYSHECFIAHVNSWAEEEAEYNWDCEMYPSLLKEALARELRLNEWTHSETEARDRMDDVEDELGYELFGETWEWDMRDFDHQFLWCCWAVMTGVQRYKAEKAKEEIPA